LDCLRGYQGDDGHKNRRPSFDAGVGILHRLDRDLLEVGALRICFTVVLLQEHYWFLQLRYLGLNLGENVVLKFFEILQILRI
jgi:hypothetical protein